MTPSLGIVLFAHGSRDPQWHRPMLAVAEQIRQSDPRVAVQCAYLELTPPTLHEAVESLASQGVREIRVVPMFLGVGKHAREDLPQLLAALHQSHPELSIACQPAVGEQSAVIELLARIALEKI